MIKRKFTALVLIFCFAAMIQAQGKKIRTFESATPSERMTTRVLFADTEKRALVGEVAIHFGQPVWKKEYEALGAFDTMTKGKVWRFGKDFWTTLDTNLTIKVAGKEIAPGAWYLGLHRSDDGSVWSLAFIDPAKARAAHLDAFDAAKAPVEFKVPVTILEKSTESKEKLVILLSSKPDNPTDLTLKIQWGPLQLSAPIQVVL
ncbi:MAG TPA: DUF2911 domain-containing protein [Blastocatellia bacterium]|jgi:hypothetical protein